MTIIGAVQLRENGNNMRWSYKTVHYELKKDGLLGGAFLDESEIEMSLNEYGKAGWELVSLLETMDGLTAVFKQPLSLDKDSFSVLQAVTSQGENDEDRIDRVPAPQKSERPRLVVEEEKIGEKSGASEYGEPLEEVVRWVGEEATGKQPPKRGDEQLSDKLQDDDGADVGSIRIE